MPNQRMVSLTKKLNRLIVVIILLVSVGLTTAGYRVHSERTNRHFYTQAERCARDIVTSIPGDPVFHLWQYIGTDAFHQVRERAVAENDPEIIRRWMEERPSYYDDVVVEDEETGTTVLSLYDDYEIILDILDKNRELFAVTNTYVQYEENDRVYTLADPVYGLLSLGEAQPIAAALDQYADNERVPATVLRTRRGWQCTACEPIVKLSDDQVAGLACVDINMDRIVRERRMFLLNNALFVLMQTIIAIAVSMALMRRFVTRPLTLLTQATTDFASGDRLYTKDDVIDLPIRSNDEIGVLYRDFQSMQGRIVDYTENLARVAAERERVNTELKMAAGIQEAMLPCVFPPFPDRKEFDLYASMTPAKAVGGDFYDFILIDDDRLMVLIADVSDKGVPAALFMMSAKIIINYRARQGGTPAEILADASAQICRDNKSRMFVTVWLGILRLSTGELTCANAGHEYPALRGADGAFSIYKDNHGMVLGALARARYRDYTLQLSPGDAVFVYTDGVPEAQNDRQEMYGMERMQAALNRAAGESPEGILNAVKADVDGFVNGATQFDDLTMLCLEYRGAAPTPSSDE